MSILRPFSSLPPNLDCQAQKVKSIPVHFGHQSDEMLTHKRTGSWLFWRFTSISLHVLALALYTYSLCYSLINYHRFASSHPDRYSAAFQQREFLGKWKFLTHWNHVLQLLYFATAVAFDLLTLALPVQVHETCLFNKSGSTSVLHAIYLFFASTVNALFHALAVPTALVSIKPQLILSF
jgi:hypothetical protein